MTELWDFLRSALTTKALAAVVDAGVPEARRDGPRPVAELLADGRERDGQQWCALLEEAGSCVESLESPIVATCR